MPAELFCGMNEFGSILHGELLAFFRRRIRARNNLISDVSVGLRVLRRDRSRSNDPIAQFSPS
jgi:hypothetical protein